MFKFIKNLFRNKKDDELVRYRGAKRPKFDSIVIGEGISNFDKIKCIKCGKISTNFKDKYSSDINAFIPSCKYCGADIMSNKFIPLDKNNREIRRN